MDAAAKGRPFSFKKPCAANSSEIARPHTVALDPLQHIREARAGVDVIGTAHGGVVELVHDLMPGAAGECLDGLPLSAVAVLVSSDFGGRTGPQIGNRRNFRLVRHKQSTGRSKN